MLSPKKNEHNSIFLSNRLEPLVDALAESVYSGFVRRKVVVPEGKLKSALLLDLAERSPQRVAVGMEIVQLAQLVSLSLPSEAELALRLEHQIASSLDTPLFASLSHYLRHSSTPLSTLSSQLARVFLHYALYGGASLKEWREQEGWQQQLFRAFDLRFALPEGVEWHLFGFHTLPPLYLEAFEKAGARFYLLSPCAHYWEDFCSERERVRLKSRLSERQQEALESYLEEQNPLLANMGRAGRSFLHRFSTSQQRELYVEPEGEGCLSRLHRSLLILEPFLPGGEGEAVELYAAHSPLHEVETVYRELALLMEREEIEPRQVQVIAPDIALYAPYIQMVFGREGAAIPYSLVDIPLHQASSSAEEFSRLLDLVSCRFTPRALFRLLSGQSFQKKHALSPADAEQILQWAEATDVRWGVDQAQREQLIEDPLLEETEAGTWKSGWEKLLLGMAMINSSLPALRFSDGELLEKAISLLDAMRQALYPLIDRQRRKASDWLALLRQLAEEFFSFSEEDAGWLRKLRQLEAAVEDLPSPLFHFATIRALVEGSMRDRAGSVHGARVQSVLFSSLPQGAMPSKKVIWLLGMQEESFPRREKPSPLSRVPLEKPSQTDLDRYLFLQMVLAAEKFFLCSYVRVASKDERPQAPSPLIQELFAYLGKRVEVLERARAEWRRLRSSSPPFFRSFYEPAKLEPAWREGERLVALRTLERCARHPIAFYLEERLGVFLERTPSKEGEFCLSPLSRAKLRAEAVAGSLEEAWRGAEARGALPLGALKESARLKIEEELHALSGSVRGPFTSLAFDRTPFMLELEGGGSVGITGSLSLLSDAGMVYYGENRLEDLLRIWPSYLLFLCNSKAGGDLLLIKKRLVRLAPPSEDPLRLLREYCAYFAIASATPSPFLPSWAEPLLQNSPEKLAKLIQKRELYPGVEDPYLTWLQARSPALSAERLCENWSPLLQRTFSIVEAWRKQ